MTMVLMLSFCAALGQHPHVGDIRGRGLFIGIVLVQCHNEKTPFDRAMNIAGAIKKIAFEAGLACYPAQGTVDGQSGDHILLAPPFIISGGEMDLLVERLERAVHNSLPS